MLRRALTGHHPLCIVYGQWLSRAMTTTTLLPRAPPDLQNPTASTTTTRHRPFSTSLVRRLPRGASERSSRLDKKTRNSSLRVGGTSRRPSPSSGAARAPGSGGDARVPDSDSDLVVVRNSTRTRRVSKLRRNGITTQAKASPAHAVRSSTRRPRALRPILIPPTFPPSLLSKTNPPISEPYQDLSEWRGDDDDKATKTDAGPSTTLELSGLPSNTLKTDIRYVFQRLGEIRRVFVRGSRAEVMFADVDSVKRALHAYAERPFYVQGQEIAVFRKPSNADSAGVSDLFPGPFRMRRERDDDDGSDSSIFVANFPAGTTHEELSGVFTPLGRYERFVMRTCFSPCRFSFGTIFFLSQPTRMLFRSWFKIRAFRVFERRSRRIYFACPPARSDHLPGAILAHRALQEHTALSVG